MMPYIHTLCISVPWQRACNIGITHQSTLCDWNILLSQWSFQMVLAFCKSNVGVTHLISQYSHSHIYTNVALCWKALVLTVKSYYKLLSSLIPITSITSFGGFHLYQFSWSFSLKHCVPALTDLLAAFWAGHFSWFMADVCSQTYLFNETFLLTFGFLPQ